MVLSVSFGFYISRLLLNDKPLNPPSPYHPSLRPSDANFNCLKLAQLMPNPFHTVCNCRLSHCLQLLIDFRECLSRVPSLPRSIHILIYRLFYIVLKKIEIKKTMFILIIEKSHSVCETGWYFVYLNINYTAILFNRWPLNSTVSANRESCHYTWLKSVIRYKCKRHGVVVVGGGCWRRRPLVIDAHPWEPICRGVLSLSPLFILWSITPSSWRRDILSQTRRRSVWPLHCYYSSSETGLFFFFYCARFFDEYIGGECRMGVAECR